MRAVTMALAVLAGSGALAMTRPAFAQENAGDKVVQKYVYGDDACEPSADPNEIVVCMRMDEEDRFRIPKSLRGDPNAPASQAWTERVRSLERVGAFGTDSCSPVGAGGFTGCTQQLVRDAYAERAKGSDVQAGKLIEEARQERLSKIDEEAAAVEAREQEIEAQLEARAAKRQAEEAAANGRSEPVSDGDPSLAMPPPE